MNVLVLGANGMLGNAIFRLFYESHCINVYGTIRSSAHLEYLPKNTHKNLVVNTNIECIKSLADLFKMVRPNVVINCIGLIKQFPLEDDFCTAISINALFPHRLAVLCGSLGIRLVHISTDCVFSGLRGGYTEEMFPDADDVYGRTKYLGEVNYPGAITLRTSIIGHELNSTNSLINWFLKQDGAVKGYKNAIFSGLPTVEIARIIRDFVIPNENLRGVYHVSSSPISKHDLLRLVADTYGKKIRIIEDEEISIDRSLISARFSRATGFIPKSWPEQVRIMYEFR